MAAALAPFCNWLASTELSHKIQTVTWIIPTLQTIHILSIAGLFSSAILVDLRFWRIYDRDLPLQDVARRYLPVIWPVVLALAVTGALLIIGEPRRSLLNTTFYIKMALLAAALVMTAVLQWPLSKDANFWDKDQGHRIAGRLAAVVSILIWSCIIFAGRWIAYTEVG